MTLFVQRLRKQKPSSNQAYVSVYRWRRQEISSAKQDTENTGRFVLDHFIGQEDHEYGDVSPINKNVAEPGMIFSIEPGIYIEGKYGVRIEDLVLVTEDGYELLNVVDKKYRTVG